MRYNFDEIHERRGTDSHKWQRYGEGVLPMWVADMDFVSPEPVMRALQQRVAQGIFGYPHENTELKEAVCERLERRYGWQVPLEALVLLPGVVTGFNLACHAFAAPGEGVLVQTPVYKPIRQAYQCSDLGSQQSELARQPDGSYGVDWERFEEAITSETRLFLLCNPHNPVGRVFRKDELERMAEICLRHKVLICSDEIHSDLVYPGQQHTPIACLSPEVAANSITLLAPSKTFNIAGLQCSFAVVPNPELRKRYLEARQGLVSWVNLLGQVAALAAYRDGQDWLDQVMAYLEGNRDLVVDFVNREMPGISVASPEATYLAWLDCNEAELPGGPFQFFLEKARVALNDGAEFGCCEGFVRLNFACPRSMLLDGLERMKAALIGGRIEKSKSE